MRAGMGTFLAADRIRLLDNRGRQVARGYTWDGYLPRQGRAGSTFSSRFRPSVICKLSEASRGRADIGGQIAEKTTAERVQARDVRSDAANFAVSPYPLSDKQVPP